MIFMLPFNCGKYGRECVHAASADIQANDSSSGVVSDEQCATSDSLCITSGTESDCITSTTCQHTRQNNVVWWPFYSVMSITTYVYISWYMCRDKSLWHFLLSTNEYIYSPGRRSLLMPCLSCSRVVCIWLIGNLVFHCFCVDLSNWIMRSVTHSRLVKLWTRLCSIYMYFAGKPISSVDLGNTHRVLSECIKCLDASAADPLGS